LSFSSIFQPVFSSILPVCAGALAGPFSQLQVRNYVDVLRRPSRRSQVGLCANWYKQPSVAKYINRKRDHIRRAVKPLYTDVRLDSEGNTVGVVEFESQDDMKLAIRKLDDTEFRNP
ncbi:uncharacterized protein HaLaN_23902, partial [Haematococcus lacustris]